MPFETSVGYGAWSYHRNNSFCPSPISFYGDTARRVSRFSRFQEGMGQLKIVPGGLRLDGKAFVMGSLIASNISSRTGQPIVVESSKKLTLSTRKLNGQLENMIFIGKTTTFFYKIICLLIWFQIHTYIDKKCILYKNVCFFYKKISCMFEQLNEDIEAVSNIEVPYFYSTFWSSK